MTLASDCNRYRNIFYECGSLQKFEEFRQLLNLFLLPSHALPEFVHEETVALMDLQEVALFVSKREDFKTAKISKLLPSIF